MKFEQLSLDARVLAGVKAAGYIKPTPIQEQAIPAVLAGRDVLGLAQTGTGKTAAFMLPILDRLVRSGPRRRIRALIVASETMRPFQTTSTNRSLVTSLPAFSTSSLSRSKTCGSTGTGFPFPCRPSAALLSGERADAPRPVGLTPGQSNPG